MLPPSLARLPPISALQRRTERESYLGWSARPSSDRHRLRAVSLAIGNVSSTRPEFSSRSADAFQWSIAAASAFGIAESHMRIALCPDTLARAVASFANENATGKARPPNSS